ncbi:hypothetical protein CBOM_00228 [Ceraceosorus bombacis]|uniref:Uncharacterized protein n=1 Tax=Ceraceosorus bombacis TaxID=401625 RepID=A0A0P1B979_9BASI|nr:hypothetical protein CBOM_00228 [Ceraceosorus bombacis]
MRGVPFWEKLERRRGKEKETIVRYLPASRLKDVLACTKEGNFLLDSDRACPLRLVMVV